MTSLNEPQTGAVAHETSAANAAAGATHDAAGNTTSAASTENLIEHPRGAEPGKPGRRDAFYFEQKTRLPDAADGKGRGGARYGRTGIIHTPHGDIHTPAFVPVATQAAMKAVLPETMKDLGAQCLLSNAFHLYERPGEQVLDEAGGLARFMNWNGPTFTDSGGFQVLSLGAGFKKTLAMDVTGMKSDDVIAEGKERLAFVDEDGVTFKSPLNGSLHRFSAEISMGIQHKIGADIMFAFDELTTLMNTRGYQERSVERTYRWAQRCVAEHKRLTEERLGKPYQALYGVVQGANYEDLRRHAAEQIASLDFDGVGIGGAIVRDGEIVSGSHGFAGEIGHVSVSLDGPLCGCGRRGCLETYAGRRALVEASGVAEKNAASSGEALERLLDAWHSHDVRTVEAVGRAIDALASAIGSALNLADVDTVLLGGWWTDFGPFFYETLENRLESQVLGASDMQVSVSIPLVADHPALYGAAEVGLRKFIDNPLTFITDKA